MPNINNTVAVIGGTGKSGQYLLQRLTALHIPVRLLLRTPGSFNSKNPLISIVEGNAGNAADVFRLLQGSTAVLSTLGQRGNASSIFSAATSNVLAAMNRLGIKRYVVTTGLNVDTPQDRKNSGTRMATEWMKNNYPATTADKQVEYDMLVASDTDWTLVRLPLIELTDEMYAIRTSLEDCQGDKVSATVLANFLVSQLSDTQFIRQAPFLFR